MVLLNLMKVLFIFSLFNSDLDKLNTVLIMFKCSMFMSKRAIGRIFNAWILNSLMRIILLYKLDKDPISYFTSKGPSKYYNMVMPALHKGYFKFDDCHDDLKV